MKDLICLLKESKVFFFPLKDLQEFFDDLVCFLIEPSEFLRFGIHVLYGMEKSGLGKEIYRERERKDMIDTFAVKKKNEIYFSRKKFTRRVVYK